MSDKSPGQSLHPDPAEPPVEAVSPCDGRPVHIPEGFGMFGFAVLAGLRAEQLLRGCVPRVERGGHRATVVAQLEVAGGKISPLEHVVLNRDGQ